MISYLTSSIIYVFLEETDAIDKETPTYPSATFLADVGGAAGLIFGLNIMETDFLNINFRQFIMDLFYGLIWLTK